MAYHTYYLKKEDFIVMPKKGCSVCKNKYIEEINALILEGVSIREIARRYAFSEPTMRRHKHKCVDINITPSRTPECLSKNAFTLPKLKENKKDPLNIRNKRGDIPTTIKKAILVRPYKNIKDIDETDETDETAPKNNDIGAWIEYLRNYLVKFIIKCEKEGQDHLTLLAIRELRGSIELMIKAYGAILDNESRADASKLVQVITKALSPYKDASIAVSNELSVLEK